jgi:hypothetical protein
LATPASSIACISVSYVVGRSLDHADRLRPNGATGRRRSLAMTVAGDVRADVEMSDM